MRLPAYPAGQEGPSFPRGERPSQGCPPSINAKTSKTEGGPTGTKSPDLTQPNSIQSNQNLIFNFSFLNIEPLIFNLLFFNFKFVFFIFSKKKSTNIMSIHRTRVDLLLIESRFASPHLTSPHRTSLHFTSLHFTSLHFTSLHFTSLHFTSLHFTSLHFTSLHFTGRFM